MKKRTKLLNNRAANLIYFLELSFITCYTIINWHSSFEALCFLKLYSIFIVLHSTYFGERYENKLKSIFDQWLNLNLGLNARLEIEIFNRLYWKCNLRPIVYFWNPCQLDITINLPRFMGWIWTFIDFVQHVYYKLFNFSAYKILFHLHDSVHFILRSFK